MKIGLVRHFEVDKKYLDGYIKSEDFSKWMKEYDYADVFPREIDLRGIDWNKCYSSDLSRAVTTAEAIYDGKIIKTPLIREIAMQFTDEFHKDIETTQKFFNWSIYSMLKWAKDKEEVVKEPINESRQRVEKFLVELFENSEEDDNILIVCHGMIMTVIEDKLRLKGFKGDRVVAAKNGEIFVLEN